MRRPEGSKTGATYFQAKSLAIIAEIRTVSHYVARYRIATPGTKPQRSAADGHAERADVAAAVKGT